MTEITPRFSLSQYITTHFFVWGLFLLLPLTELAAQNSFEKGKQLYEQRASGADSLQADPTNITKAIEAFNQSLKQNINPEQSAAYLLRSYYFKGMFTGLSEDQQQEIYDKGRTLGEKMMERFPNSVPIKFWYGANLGRWADVYGFVRAATSGIAKKLRRISEDIIEQNPEYQGGGGYRILAQVHFHSPSIPLVMSWPSKDKALELGGKAMEVSADHPANRILYAQILLELNRHDEAQKNFQQILDMAPRETHIVEDRYIKHRSRQLLNEHF